MIPNAAQNSFWMFRYLERGEVAARTLLSAHLFKLENHALSLKAEDILLTLSSEKSIFAQLYPKKFNDNELVQYFLTWQEMNPSSLFNTFKNAREDGKLIRNVIGKMIWKVINELYVWLLHPEAKKLYDIDRQLFYQRFLQQSQQLKGGFYNSQSQDFYYHMMELGIRLERAYQALKNIAYLQAHASVQAEASQRDALGSEFDLTRFLLECNACTDCYLKMNYTFDIQACMNFFLFEKVSPRSLTHSIESLSRTISAMRDLSPQGFPKQLNLALKKSAHALALLSDGNISSKNGMQAQHKILSGLNAVSSSIEATFCKALSICKFM